MPNHRLRLIWILAVATVALTCAPRVAAQYCALRDPVRKIYELYPEATSYRSIVKTVDETARAAVSDRVPLELHFNELGRHTLYVAFQDDVPIGLVHVRSEKGRWGLNENTWALDLDLRVQGFSFQRCRDPQRISIESEEFQSHILGCGLREIEAMLSDDATKIVASDVRVPQTAESLALSVLHSAMKTIVVTEQVWKSDLEILRTARLARLAYPGSDSVNIVDDAYSDDVMHAVQRAVGGESGIQRDSARLIRVLDEDGSVMGSIVCAQWKIGSQDIHLGWVVSPALEIARVIPVGAWPNEDIKRVCREIEGLTIADLEDCASPMQLAGAEALLLSQVHIGTGE